MIFVCICQYLFDIVMLVQGYEEHKRYNIIAQVVKFFNLCTVF